MLATAFLGSELYYNTGEKAYAAEFVGASNGSTGNQTIKGSQNMGTIDNSGATTYWFAGNAFYGMVRSGVEFGEDYDTSDWLLVDTDAMWGGEYLFSTWGNAYRADGSDLYTTSEDANAGGVADVNKVYYQKILTYGERLWSNYGSTWFTGKESSAVGTATVTTTNNSYRTFEDYIGGASSVGTYNYWIGAATADSIANSYTITHVKKWYETGSTDTTKYGTLTTPQDATTYENATTNYISSSNYNGITEDMLGVKSSNIYSIVGAHLYAPSVGELEANENVYKKIVTNVYADYTAETNETGNWGPNGGWFSAATTTATANPAGHLWDRTRTSLWSRSFSGLRMGDSGFGAWCVYVGGCLNSYNYLTDSHAVAPAFNLDTSSVIMARSAVASTTPSSELASYNPNELGANVEFSLESDKLSITTDIAGKQLNNVVAGQTYDIAYSGASLSGEAHNNAASETFYVSAAIYDSNNVMKYYGKLGAVANSGAGTVSVTIPSTLEAGQQYKLAIFEEQAIGTYNTTTPSGKRITTYTTDYVSPMNVATFTLDSLAAKVNDGASLVEETTYSVTDIAEKITVTSASQGVLTYGTDYIINSVTGDATVDGSNITTGDNGSKNSKELTFEIKYANESMSVVPTTTVTLVVNSADTVGDDTYQGDQESETDENGFYSWKDDVSGITWKYKTNDVGNITYLYTPEDPSRLIDAAGTLNIPSRVAGLTVIGIGGGSEDTPVVSMEDGDWRNLSLPETVTTINDYAFVKAQQQNANIIIPSTVSKIGAKAFYKSTIASVKINGMKGEIGYLAFGNCSNLSNVIIKGNDLTIKEEAFSCSGITNLTLSGNVTVQKNAFNEAIGIKELYLPNGITLEAYAFNGCSGIEVLECNMSTLTNNAFAGCTSIKTLILDDAVESIAYDWNGHTASVDRNVYVKNGNTKFQFYGNGGTYYSAYGTSGNVRVVYDEGTDEGTDLSATNNVLTAITKTLASHTNKYQEYYKGQAASVTFVYDGAKTTEQIMAEDGISDIIEATDVQTGIEVSFDGTLLTTQAIDKNKVNVTALFGNIEGLNYDSEHFYVIRTEEFNSLSRNNAVTEEAVAAFEPLTAQDSDLQNGLSAAIVVFTTVSGDVTSPVYTAIENNGYFYATVSVRVEKYSDEDYVKENYGSYTEIVNEINGLNNSITVMEESMKDTIAHINETLDTSFDANPDNVVEEYEKAVQALSDALSASIDENERNIAEIQALINSVNATYGVDITLSDNASTTEINTAIAEALQVVRDDQTAKNETIASLKEEYVSIAKMLSDYMANTENMEADAVDETTIAEIKAAITVALADLNTAEVALDSIETALANLRAELEEVLGSLNVNEDDSLADQIDSITTIVVEKINGLNGEITSMEESMKGIIEDINSALGTSFDVNAEELIVEYEKAVQALSDALSSSVKENADNIAEVKALLTHVNTTYGSNIVLADDATTEQINEAITEALQVIRDDQTAKENTITSLKVQYVEIAQLLSNYMSDVENMEADAVDGTTINDIKVAIAAALADLNEAKDELSDIDAALDKLYEALNDAMISMPSIMDAEGESAADKINSITAMINTLTNNYEANNSYLRECIAEIDKAFGYGYYPKYEEKYVFYINNTDYTENGLPELLFYVKTEPKTYLVSADMCTFTAYENQELAAQIFGSTDGVKYFYLEDTVNGWSPMQTNPLNDYKKAMASLLSGFNVYGENAEVLIQTVNTICGYEVGDENYISIPTNASATEITTAMNSALTAVDTKLSELDAQNTVFATQYAEAAEALAEFLDKDYGDAVTSEDADEIATATRIAVAELAKIREEMSDVNAALDNLFAALENAFLDMGLGVESAEDGEESDESAAEKIESISGMIALITDSYNRLNEAYGILSSDYQSVLDFVYGEDEKLVGQVTPEQIQQQIEKNQQEAIDAAVEKALEEAEIVGVDAEQLQNEIAITLDAILEGEDIETSGMSQELVTAFGKVQELQANVASMQATVDGYESFLTTLKNALNLDDTATTADIIAAIQGMKNQIAELSEKVNALSTENATLSAENTELKSQIEAGAGNYDEGYAAGYAAGQASIDTDGTYQNGYAAGYADGQASIDTSDNSETYKRGYNAGYAAGKAENSSDNGKEDAAYQNGFNAGYAAGVASVDTSTTGPTYTAGYNAGYLKGFTDGSADNVVDDEKIIELTEKIQSLTTENAYLSAEVTTLQTNNAELAENVSSLTTANTSLTNRVNTLTTDKANLKGQVDTLNSQVNVLKNQVATLTNKLEDALKDSGNEDTTSDKEDTTTGDVEEETEDLDINADDVTDVDKNNTLVSATTPKYDLGTVIETLLPDSKESDTVAKNQVATTVLNKLENSRAALSTNADSTKNTTEEQLSNAYLILAYYMNHLDELGDLGSEEIKEAARDENTNVVFDVIASVNVEASEEQLKAMAANKSATLTLSSNDFKDGELYFVIHESSVRANTYDLLLVTADNGELSMELPDFSPVTITKVSIKNAAPVIENSEEDTENESFVVESIENETDENNETFKVVFDIVIIIAVILLIVIVLYFRKKKRSNTK